MEYFGNEARYVKWILAMAEDGIEIREAYIRGSVFEIERARTGEIFSDLINSSFIRREHGTTVYHLVKDVPELKRERGEYKLNLDGNNESERTLLQEVV